MKAERDAARADLASAREVIGLKAKTVSQLIDERDAAQRDLQAANEAIRKMGETADAERRKLQAEVERLKESSNLWFRRACHIKNAVAKFLNARGNDLCHENRHELAESCGLFPGKPDAGNVDEFDEGCQNYQRELFGTCGRDKLREQVEHQTACINAMGETCARYAKRLDEAVELLERWENCACKDVQADIQEETANFLAAHDAEGKAEQTARIVGPDGIGCATGANEPGVKAEQAT